MLTLGIESSCDETAAAVLENGSRILSDVVNSQIDVHEKYGGVVPELASRKHLENIYPVVDAALDQAGVDLDDIDCIAVTRGPGLIGSLLVGFSFAKALALVKNIPCVGVDHMAGHLLSVFLDNQEMPPFPYIALVASGGHSSLFVVRSPVEFQMLGRTRDDAAGEAFDKVAKLLGLGYPGGPVISRLAADGDPGAIDFPRAWLGKESYDFSFSGLKTAVANYVNQRVRAGNVSTADVCASFQEAVADVLVEKSLQAARLQEIPHVVLAGGVAANLRLRSRLLERGGRDGCRVYLPPVRFCTDNAAMIALAGFHLYGRQAGLGPDADVYSRSAFTPII